MLLRSMTTMIDKPFDFFPVSDTVVFKFSVYLNLVNAHVCFLFAAILITLQHLMCKATQCIMKAKTAICE